MSLGSLVGMSLSSFIPSDNPTVRVMAGGIIGGIIENGIDKLSKLSIGLCGQKGIFGGILEKGKDKLNQTSANWRIRQMFLSSFSIVINSSDDNLIYNKLERFLVTRHQEKVRSCILKPKNGEIIISLSGANIFKSIKEE